MPPASFARLDAGGERTAREWLAEVEPRERADRPFVFANFVSTLDGRAAIAGSTKALGERPDLEMLLELRCLPDAVLVGAGTIRAERYGRLVRSEERRAYRAARGLAPDPLAVTISRGLDLPWDAGLFADPAQPVLVYTGVEGPAPVETARVDSLPAALADLRARGVRTLLCEGGPHLFGSLVADGLVDELFLTLAPVLTGETHAPRVIEGGDLPQHARAELRWILGVGGEVFLRYGLRIASRP